MNQFKVGRPTESEIDRIEELANRLFVDDSWTINSKMWDDGDVHLTAYSTVGTSYDEGYPSEVVHHRQFIIYERFNEEAVYLNKLRLHHPRPDRELDRRELDVSFGNR